MRRTSRFSIAVATAASLCIISHASYAQVIGSYDNFDCFNDTGETAEGFEIDVEDVSVADITRAFPSNFSGTPWVIRYGLPSITGYDWSSAAPDPDHAYNAGKKGVLITWAATWDGAQWVAAHGDYPFGATIAGHGTPYVANPSYTNGDSCWYYGLGNAYPSSGCDHFGISLAAGVTPGKIKYHWKVPNPRAAGTLMNFQREVALPPSPILAPLPEQPAVVHAVAEAPENPEPVWSDAYWVRTTTYFGRQRAMLDYLQKGIVKGARVAKVVKWNLLQRPPAGNDEAIEREDVEDHAIPLGYLQVTKQYEYFRYRGAYDSGTHEVLCGIVAAGLMDDCTRPYLNTYTVTDPETKTPVTVTGGDLGRYLGAHINAYNVQ